MNIFFKYIVAPQTHPFFPICCMYYLQSYYLRLNIHRLTDQTNKIGVCLLFFRHFRLHFYENTSHSRGKPFVRIQCHRGGMNIFKWFCMESLNLLLWDKWYLRVRVGIFFSTNGNGIPSGGHEFNARNYGKKKTTRKKRTKIYRKKRKNAHCVSSNLILGHTHTRRRERKSKKYKFSCAIPCEFLCQFSSQSIATCVCNTWVCNTRTLISIVRFFLLFYLFYARLSPSNSILSSFSYTVSFNSIPFHQLSHTNILSQSLSSCAPFILLFLFLFHEIAINLNTSAIRT